MTAATQIRGQLAALPRRSLAITGGVILAYLLLYVVPGSPLPDWAPLGVVLIGAVFGTATGLLAMGLVLIYRANRIVNFAYGSMGGVAGVFAINLFLRSEVNYLVCLVVAVVLGAVVGALVEVGVIRRFARAPRLVLTVATIGLAQLLGGIELLIPGQIFGSSGMVLGGYATPLQMRVEVAPVLFTGDHMLIVLTVPVLAAALGWFLVGTDLGVAVRGAAENEERARLLGIPVRRVSLAVWTLAGTFSALVFFLKAPFMGVTPGVLAGPVVLLPGLAAAVLARMESLPRAAVAGVALGVLEQLVLWNVATPALVDVAFLLVILGALLAQRDRLNRALDAGSSSWSAVGVVRRVPAQLRHLPEVRAARLGLIGLVVVVALVAPTLYGPSAVSLMSAALIFSIVALSLVVLTGWAGHISLGQFAVVGAAAIVAGNLVLRWNVDLFYTLIVAGVVGGLVALLVGLPALRIRGLFLAVTTLAFAVALNSYVLNPVNFPWLIPERIARPLLFGRIDLENETAFYYLCLAFLALAVVVANRVRRARPGRAMVAVRDNHRAAEGMAVPATATNLAAFVLSGIMAGVAGGLHVLLLHGARTGSYQPVLSLEVFSMAVIGGLGSVGGAISGVLALRWLEQLVSPAVRLLVTGTGVLVILWALPGGLGQAALSVRDRFLRTVAARRGIVVASLLADTRTEDDRPPDEQAMLASALTGGERDEEGRP